MASFFMLQSIYLLTTQYKIKTIQYEIFDNNCKFRRVDKLLLEISKNYMEFSNLEIISGFFCNRVIWIIFKISLNSIPVAQCNYKFSLFLVFIIIHQLS